MTKTPRTDDQKQGESEEQLPFFSPRTLFASRESATFKNSFPKPLNPLCYWTQSSLAKPPSPRPLNFLSRTPELNPNRQRQEQRFTPGGDFVT